MISFQTNEDTTAVMMRAKGVNIEVKTGPLFCIDHSCNQYVNAVTITPYHIPTKSKSAIL